MRSMVRTSLSVPNGQRRGGPAAGQLRWAPTHAIGGTPCTRAFRTCNVGAAGGTAASAPPPWESIILGIVIHSVARRMGEPAGALVGVRLRTLSATRGKLGDRTSVEDFMHRCDCAWPRSSKRKSIWNGSCHRGNLPSMWNWNKAMSKPAGWFQLETVLWRTKQNQSRKILRD